METASIINFTSGLDFLGEEPAASIKIKNDPKITRNKAGLIGMRFIDF